MKQILGIPSLVISASTIHSHGIFDMASKKMHADFQKQKEQEDLSLLAQAVGTLDTNSEDMYATPESRHELNMRTALVSRRNARLAESEDLETEVN